MTNVHNTCVRFYYSGLFHLSKAPGVIYGNGARSLISEGNSVVIYCMGFHFHAEVFVSVSMVATITQCTGGQTPPPGARGKVMYL